MRKLLNGIGIFTGIFIIVLLSSCNNMKQLESKDNTERPNVLLISIDGLRPDIVMDAKKHDLKIPNILKFVQHGTYAPEGGEGIMPTLTYPSHVSMLTGTNPATHGIDSNKPFDPTGDYKGAWYWFVSTEVPTLWTAANEDGYITSNVSISASTGAKFDYNVPGYFMSGTKYDSNYINQFGTPKGMLKKIEKQIGTFPNTICDLNADKKRVATAEWILKNKISKDLAKNYKPVFMSVYLGSYDEMEHEAGIFSKKSMKALEGIDILVGKLIDSVQKTVGPNLIINLVSDHGFMDISKTININTVFKKNGLIKLNKKGNVENWQVFAWAAAGSCDIRLKDQNDNKLKEQVKEILNKIASDKDNGIKNVYDKEDLKKLKGFPNADFALNAREGYAFSNECEGKLITDSGKTKATHGYSPKNKQLYFSYFIMGPGIPKGKKITEAIKLIDVAPTLAALMNVPFPDAEGRSIIDNIIN